MGGGSSSSSSSTKSETTTSTATTTGNTGTVLQGQTVSYTNNLPDAAVDVFKQLTAIVGQSIDVASQAESHAVDATNQLATAAKQPDVSVVQGAQTQNYYLIGAIAAVAIAFFIFRR